jgi:hypothetical protein
VDFDLSSWNTVSALELTASDFVHVVDPGSKPDFSATGGAIAFGAMAAAQMSGGMDFSLDNYRLYVNPVPVPGLSAWGITLCSALLIGSALWAARQSRAVESG